MMIASDDPDDADGYTVAEGDCNDDDPKKIGGRIRSAEEFLIAGNLTS